LPLVSKFIDDNYGEYAQMVKSGSDPNMMDYVSCKDVWIFLPTIEELKFEFPRSYDQFILFMVHFANDLNVVLKDKLAVEGFNADTEKIDSSCTVHTHSSDIVTFYPITFFFSSPTMKKVFILGDDVLNAVSQRQSNRIYHGMVARFRLRR
jgi:hypothetical protein